MSSKRMVNRTLLPLLLSIIMVLLSSVIGFAASNQTFTLNKGGIYASEQILVKFKSGATKDVVEKAHFQNNGKVIDIIPEINVQIVKVEKNKVIEKLSAYKHDPNVEFAEPDYLAQAVSIPNDVYFEEQWGMTKIQAPEAWDITKGSKKIKIAILDTGIDQDHEDLASKIAVNKNFTSSKTIDDMFGHGTHVAGIAAACTDNNKGVAGAGYSSTLMNIKVLGDDGSGYYSWVARGIIWSVNKGVKVINLSLAGDQPSKMLEMAVDYAWRKGVVIVAAAGNEGNSVPLYPAAYQNCIAVGATDKNGTRAFFSNYGDWVDLAAPGMNIFSTTPNHENFLNNYGIALNYDYLMGTSMASPHVAGIAALVFAKYHGISNAKVREKLEEGTDPAAGFEPWPIGRVNAYKALTEN